MVIAALGLALSFAASSDGGPTGPPPAAAPAVPAGPSAGTDGEPIDLERPEAVVVWTSGGLLPGFAGDVGALPGVTQATVVRGDRVDLTGSSAPDGSPVDILEDGWAIPLDALAIDPATYAAFVPEDEAAVIAGLGARQALLGETSARLRRAEPGSLLEVGGVALTVVGVLPDERVGDAEIVVRHDTGLEIGIERERFVLLRHEGDVSALEAAVRALLDPGTPVRVSPRADGERLRHGASVLSQVQVKDLFGEFSYRQTTQRDFTPDAAWVAGNVITERVPILGRITCHKDFMPLVRGALAELEAKGLAHLIRPREYEGCWHPRFSGARRSVSRHSWGIGIDFNAASNPYGAEPDQDPRLVEVMERWGMGWGGEWLVPDAMHFEFVGGFADDVPVELRIGE